MKRIIFYISFLMILLMGISCHQKDTSTVSSAEQVDDSKMSSVKLTAADSSAEAMLLAAKDISPMDMIYCPFEYPFLKMQGKAEKEPLARVIYSRPHKKGRSIFGHDSSFLCRYGVPWRMGANEATEIEFFSDGYFNDKQVKKGRYVIYCIPQENTWNIRLNSNCFSWGLHIDSTKDILQTIVPTKRMNHEVEDLTIFFHPSDNVYETVVEYLLNISWDRTYVIIPVSWKRQP